MERAAEAIAQAVRQGDIDQQRDMLAGCARLAYWQVYADLTVNERVRIDKARDLVLESAPHADFGAMSLDEQQRIIRMWTATKLPPLPPSSVDARDGAMGAALHDQLVEEMELEAGLAKDTARTRGVDLRLINILIREPRATPSAQGHRSSRPVAKVKQIESARRSDTSRKLRDGAVEAMSRIFANVNERDRLASTTRRGLVRPRWLDPTDWHRIPLPLPSCPEQGPRQRSRSTGPPPRTTPRRRQ